MGVIALKIILLFVACQRNNRSILLTVRISTLVLVGSERSKARRVAQTLISPAPARRGVPRPLRFSQRAGIHAVYVIEHGSHRVLSERNHFPRPRRCGIECVYTRPCKTRKDGAPFFLVVTMEIEIKIKCWATRLGRRRADSSLRFGMTMVGELKSEAGGPLKSHFDLSGVVRKRGTGGTFFNYLWEVGTSRLSFESQSWNVRS